MPNIVAFTGFWFLDDEGTMYAPSDISAFKFTEPVAVEEIDSYEESYTDE